MLVSIGKRVWEMSRKGCEGLLSMASEQIPFGIYAIEKNGRIEIRRDKCSSVTQLKSLTRQYKAAGYKVYANGR